MGYDLRNALEYLTEMANDAREPHVVEIGGKTYCDKGMQRYAKEDLAGAIQVRSLKSLVEYINGKSEELRESMIVHVEGPGFVSLVSGLTKERERETLMFARAEDVGFQFDHYYDQERFVINMQTCFEQTEEVGYITTVAGNVVNETVANYGDNGTNQKVTISHGIAGREDAEVPNPVVLRPYRTFMEVEQPESKFVFRINEDADKAPIFKLIEADGGLWKYEAVESIKEYIKKNLDPEFSSRITVIG